jgi:Zn-dependent protease
MGWEDRPYYRDRPPQWRGRILSILNGSVPLFTVFGIHVRIHASLIILILATLLFDFTQGYPLAVRAITMGLLFGIILLHEFGHSLATRTVGGTSEEILLWPLGGLASCSPPHRPWPTFVTAAGGPLVNVLICLAATAGLWLTSRLMPVFDPIHPGQFLLAHHGYLSLRFYLSWIFFFSEALLLFNLLPIYPLDGGQMLQAILWPFMGYYRSMKLSTTIGMIGAAGLAIFGIMFGPNFLLIFIAIWLFWYCWQKRAELREMAGEGIYEPEVSYNAGSYADEAPRRRRRFGRRAVLRAQRLARQEAAERERIDAILAKVSAFGMQSLSWWEKRSLRRATEHQRRRDLELSKFR